MSISPATTKQINFILTLAAERHEGEEFEAYVSLTNSGLLPKRNASTLIKVLLGVPKLAKAAAPSAPQAASGVLPGRYAVEVDGTLGFFKVDAPNSGKWAGYTFVKQLASDAEYPVKGSRKAAVLDAIKADPKAASVLYGSELGRCGVCNRTLTDAASRAAGIGPTCQENAGW